EVEATGVLAQVQRAHAEAVAGEHEALPALVPQRERPLSVHARERVLAPRFPGVHDDLGIAARAEAVSEAHQLRAQLHVVEDLAVEHDPQRLVLVGERLLAGGEVDDGEPGMGEAGVPVAVDAELIGTAMAQGPRHSQEGGARLPAGSLDVVDARYAAHARATSFTGSISRGAACR